jgi:hypothetical protein
MKEPISKGTAAWCILFIVLGTVMLTKVHYGFYGDFSIWNYLGPIVPIFMGVAQIMQDAK